MTIFANILLMALWFITGGFVGYHLGTDSSGHGFIGLVMGLILAVITILFVAVQCVPPSA